MYVPALISALALSVAGCADEGESIITQETVGHVIQPIIGGTVSGTENDAVIVLTTFNAGVRKSLCSATLVAPNLVLTARHCVSDTDGAGCGSNGNAATTAAVKGNRAANMLVVFAGTAGVTANTEVEANGTAHGARLVVDDAKTICNHDVALLILDKNIDGPVATLRLTAPTQEEKVSAVGWGVDGSGKLSPSRAIRTDIPLLLGPNIYPENPTFGYGNAEFMIGESACAGDSGGPAIAKTGAVVGVASRAGNGLASDPTNYAATCMGAGAHAVYSDLSAHKALVLRAFREAGATPKLEGDVLAKSSATSDNASGDDTAAETAGAPGSPTKTKLSASTKVTLPADSSQPAQGVGGCSMSSDPQAGSVEYAAGLVALLASLLGIRRRFGGRGQSDEGAPHRDRLPSMP